MIAILLAAALASAPPPWRDTAHHVAGYVRVARDVRIHYLDFGGNGPSLVFLAGLGNTAHAFDELAPLFTDRFHVYALTRRGFGESDHPASGYSTERLVTDIRAVLDSLHISRASFVGHSIAGEELTRLAATAPPRVDRLVYLDAAYDRVRAQEDVERLFANPPNVAAAPRPTAADVASPEAYVAFVHRTRGVNIPESDIRTRYRFDGWQEEATLAYKSIESEHPNYRAVRAPALAIYAVIDSVSQLEPWQRDDLLHRQAWQDVVRTIETIYRPLRAQFKSQVANGQVLELHGAHHWIFVSNRDTVVAAMRAFLLPSRRPVG